MTSYLVLVKLYVSPLLKIIKTIASVYIAVFCKLLNHAVKPTFVCRLNMYEHNSTYKISKHIL